jgi:hypothetical protein
MEMAVEKGMGWDGWDEMRSVTMMLELSSATAFRSAALYGAAL